MSDIADIIAGELKVSRGTAYDLMREALKDASEKTCYCMNCEELGKQVTALRLSLEVERGFKGQK